MTAKGCDTLPEIKCTVDLKQVEALQKALSAPEFRKVIRNAMSRTATSMKKEAAELVESQYNLSSADVKKSVGVSQRSSSDSLGILYKGNLFTTGRFATGRINPLEVNIRNGPQTLSPKAFVAYGKSFGGGRDRALIFQREGEQRYPIKALRTFAIPQAVGREDNAETLADFGAKELEAYVVAGVARKLSVK